MLAGNLLIQNCWIKLQKTKLFMDNQKDTNQIDLLWFFYSQSRDEIRFLRERQDKIFTWSSNVLILIIGVLLVIDPTRVIIWSNLGVLGQIIASISIFLIVIFSVRWQQRNRSWQEENKEVVNRIAVLLHCFDKSFFKS